MNKETIVGSILPAVEGRGCFLVDVTVSAANDVEVVIEKEEGSVDWDDCAAIDQAFHALFDQDAEDYALTVSSAGLDRPFKVFRQYRKAVGTKVDVKFRGGRRLVATLADATEETVTLEYTALETVEGRKKKEKVAHSDIFSLAEINSVTPYVDFDK
jgi:ribosome maturation factor RimP